MTQSSRRALVTGASGAIGTAIALALADAGHELIVHAHGHSERAEAVASRIRDSGGQARAIVFDVADAAASRQAVETLIAEQPIQIIVNNAGIHDDAPMAGMSEAQWRRVIDVSLHGFFNVTQPALLAMARTRFGRIVSVSSVAAVLGNRGQTNYAAAKAGLHGAPSAGGTLLRHCCSGPQRRSSSPPCRSTTAVPRPTRQCRSCRRHRARTGRTRPPARRSAATAR